MKAVKFATQLDAEVAKDLRAFAVHADRSISGIVNEAVAEYLQRRRVRPAFRAALDEVLTDHDELLRRLAK
jgi:predicted transcriptional regulator